MSFNKRHKKLWPKELPLYMDFKAQTLFNNLSLSAHSDPKSDAIIFYENKISYEELFTHVNKIAGFLNVKLKISRGDRIAIIMQNCPQFIISYYAILGVNCVIVPVNPMLQVDEISFILRDSNIKAIFAASDILNTVDTALKKINCISIPIISINYLDYIKKRFNVKLPKEFENKCNNKNNIRKKKWKDIVESKALNFHHDNKPDEVCIIPYTSGSTGIPKGCIHTHKTVNAVINAYAKWLPIPKKSRVLTTLPLFHVTGMQNSMNVPIFNGNTIVLMTRWDIDTALFYIKKYRIKSWRSITASMIDLVGKFKPLKHNIASLISVGGGGASMPKSIALKLKKLTNLDYIEAYGLTETMAPTHINPPHKTKLDSIGIPIFNVDARIIDIDKNIELGVNQVGELIISSPQLFLGYLNNDNNHKYFMSLDNKNFFKTGDLAYFDKDGYFFVVDRLKRMINSSGYKIWPAEIEKILYNFEGVKEVCVIGVPDLRSGQKVKAIIVPENSYSEKKIINLKQWCSSRMAKYKIPKIFEIRKSLPKNKMGKIMWREVK